MVNKQANRDLREKVFSDIRQGLREELDIELGIDEIKFILAIQRKAMVYCVANQLDFKIPEIGLMKFSPFKASLWNVPIITKPEEPKPLIFNGITVQAQVVKNHVKVYKNESASKSTDDLPNARANGTD